MTVGLVVVSHSAKAAEGIRDVAAEMGGDARIEPVDGDGDGGIGTNAPDVRAAIEAVAADADGVVVLVDLGSAVMNTELAIEMAEADGLDADVVVADAPVLEGALNAAVEATSSKATVESVRDAAVDARDYHKLS